MTPEKPIQCERCGAKIIKLRRVIIANGASQIRWYCITCNKPALKVVKNLPHDYVNKIINGHGSIDDIPIAKDNRNETTICIVCGANSSEYHHWLPQCFRDVVPNHESWPGDNLCKSCHDIWHETVTPYLGGRGKTPEAQHTIEKYIKGMKLCTRIR